MDAIGDLAILDLALAGTHDSLTYDLGGTIAESGCQYVCLKSSSSF